MLQRDALNIQRSAASAGASGQSAALAQRNKEWESEFGLERFKTGLEGLGSLYTSSPEEYMRNKSFDLENRELTGNLTGNFGNSMFGMQGENPWVKGAKIAGSSAAAYMTGGASLAFDQPWSHI